MTGSRSRLVATALRLAASLLVLVLFAVLVYRLANGMSGSSLARAVDAHRAPTAPNVKLSVIWGETGTWPEGLRASVGRGTLWLDDLRGYPVVLNFWASWCSPCQREAGVLSAAAKARRGRVAFVGVDVNDLTSDARTFLRSHDVPYVAVKSGRSLADRFGLIGLPETFYVDRNGHIRDMTRGELSAAALARGLARIAGT